MFFAYSKRTAFSDLCSPLFFCVKNAFFSRKCDPWVVVDGSSVRNMLVYMTHTVATFTVFHNECDSVIAADRVRPGQCCLPGNFGSYCMSSSNIE